jgi:very-short-patch-repair endonuclease
VHLTRVLPAEHRRAVVGIPVTSPARTLFDLAALDRPERVEVALDDALVRRLCTLRQVNMALFALAGRGRSGVGTMRRLLADRGEGEVVPASKLEARFRRLVREHRLPMPTFEADLGDEAWIGRVDAVWRDALLVVELDGRRWHDGRLALERDRARDNRLMAQGWRVLRFTWDDLARRPLEAVATVLRALGQPA